MAPDSPATTTGKNWGRVLAVNLTGYFGEPRNDPDPDDAGRRFRRRSTGSRCRTPPRMVGTPEDIANAVLYLASDLSALGTDILIDGGLISALAW